MIGQVHDKQFEKITYILLLVIAVDTIKNMLIWI